MTPMFPEGGQVAASPVTETLVRVWTALRAALMTLIFVVVAEKDAGDVDNGCRKKTVALAAVEGPAAGPGMTWTAATSA
jgi:hypothetical protein